MAHLHPHQEEETALLIAHHHNLHARQGFGAGQAKIGAERASDGDGSVDLETDELEERLKNEKKQADSVQEQLSSLIDSMIATSVVIFMRSAAQEIRFSDVEFTHMLIQDVFFTGIILYTKIIIMNKRDFFVESIGETLTLVLLDLLKIIAMYTTFSFLTLISDHFKITRNDAIPVILMLTLYFSFVRLIGHIAKTSRYMQMTRKPAKTKK
jgi:hypothetical protein